MSEASYATEPQEPQSPRQKAVQRILWGLAAMGAVMLYGTVGYLLLGWSLGDAVYMVAITVSTVGFTEVNEINTGLLRAHTILVIFLGYVTLGYMLTGLLTFITEEELRRFLGLHRVRKQIETLRGHTIVAGMGRMGSLVCSELQASGEPFVLIDRSHDRAAEIERRGWLYVIGDASEEKVLQEAGLSRARALVSALPSDADNVFITLTARELAPKVQIIARAEQPSTQKKLKQAGADHVVLPATIGAQRIASILTNPSAVKFTELVTHRSSLDIEMADVDVREGGPFAGRTLRDLDIGRRTGVIVLAIKRADGRVEFPPSGDEAFAPGDVIVLLGRPESFEQFRGEFGA